jgi:hypothetical protein
METIDVNVGLDLYEVDKNNRRQNGGKPLPPLYKHYYLARRAYTRTDGIAAPAQTLKLLKIEAKDKAWPAKSQVHLEIWVANKINKVDTVAKADWTTLQHNYVEFKMLREKRDKVAKDAFRKLKKAEEEEEARPVHHLFDLDKTFIQFSRNPSASAGALNDGKIALVYVVAKVCHNETPCLLDIVFSEIIQVRSKNEEQKPSNKKQKTNEALEEIKSIDFTQEAEIYHKQVL